MINRKTALNLGFGTDGAVTTTVSNQLARFSDGQSHTATANNFLQITFTKAINTIFVYIPTPSATPLNFTLNATQPNGDIIVTDGIIDGTRGLTQSGFISWEPELNKYYVFNAGDLFTYNFQYDAVMNGVVFNGINLLFCDKFDLLREYPDLDNLLELSSEAEINTRLIRVMEATKDEIEKKVKNSDLTKENRQNFRLEVELDEWDLLEIQQVNEAAIYWTLGKLFYFLSDNPNDIYQQRAQRYLALGESAFESINLSIDFNDDGSLDTFSGERQYDNIEITLER